MAIKGVAFRLSRQLLTLAGADATGITPTVRIKVDADVWKPATNAPTEPDAVNDPGAFEILLDGGEMAGDQIQVVFREATIATVLTTIDTVDPALFKADVSEIPAYGDSIKRTRNVSQPGANDFYETIAEGTPT